MRQTDRRTKGENETIDRREFFSFELCDLYIPIWIVRTMVWASYIISIYAKATRFYRMRWIFKTKWDVFVSMWLESIFENCAAYD